MSKEEQNKYPFGFEGEFKNILEEVGDNADWSDIESLKDRCMQVCKDYHQEQLKGVTYEAITTLERVVTGFEWRIDSKEQPMDKADYEMYDECKETLQKLKDQSK